MFRIFLLETYEVQDCQYYNTNEVTRTTTQGSTIYDNNMSQALPTKCEISFDISSDNVSGTSERRFFILPKSQYSSGTTQPSYSILNQIAGNDLQFIVRENNSFKDVAYALTDTVVNNQYYTVKYVRDGTSVKRYLDNVLIDTITVNFLDNYSDWTLSMMRWAQTGTTKIKNVKIKAL